MNPWKLARFHRWRRVTLKIGGFSPSSPHPRRQKKGPFKPRYRMTLGLRNYALTRHFMYDCDWHMFVLDKKLRRKK